MIQLVVIFCEFIFSTAALFCLSICLYVCFRSNSFHSYFRALLLMILSILFAYEALVILITFNEIFPDFSASIRLPEIRWVGQVVTFITLTIAFLIISIERTVAVSFCSKYESFTSAWPVAGLFVATTVFSFAFKVISDYYEVKGLVLGVCLCCDVATFLTLIITWRRNRSLRAAHSCRERSLTTKYQLSENERIAHLLFPMTLSMMVAKVFVFAFIYAFRLLNKNNPRAILFFSACRLTISIYSMSCLPLFYHLHKPYRLGIQSALKTITFSYLNLQTEESIDSAETILHAESKEGAHRTYFNLLEEQWKLAEPQ